MLQPHVDADRKRWQVRDNQNSALIFDKKTGAGLRCLASDPRRAHGLQPVLVIADEPAQWPFEKSDAMIAALRTSLGKLPGAKFLAIGTRPDDSQHWFSKMLDDADYSASYHADHEAEPLRPESWLAANPSLPYMPHLEAVIKREAARAANDPAQLASFKALRLNQGGDGTISQALVPLDTWRAAEIENDADAPALGPTIWGVDTASTGLAAIACYYPTTGRLDALVGCANVPTLAERGLRAGAGRTYIEAHARGELVLAGDRTLDLATFFRAALDRWGPPTALVSDRWRKAELLGVLQGWFPIRYENIHWRGVGYASAGEDIRAFRRAFLDGDVLPVPNLALRDGFRWAITQADPAGNEKLRRVGKTHYDDAAAATVITVGAACREPRIRRPSQQREDGIAQSELPPLQDRRQHAYTG